MNVFVLGTGRCGTVTFSRACQHLANYTSGHETLAEFHGPARFAYPDEHIEADNRLAWFLGELASRFAERQVFFVHLRRDPEAVALSYLRRWDGLTPFRASIIRAFGYGIVERTRDWPDHERLELCRSYVRTVTANIEQFLCHRQSMTVWLEEVHSSFPIFLDRIKAEGDLERALAEWNIVHNPTATANSAASQSAAERQLADRLLLHASAEELVRVLARRVRKRLRKTIHVRARSLKLR